MAKAASAIFEGDAAMKWLDRLAKRVRDAEKGIDEFAGVLSSTVFQDVIGHFEQQMGSEGPWKAWSTAYADHMREIGKGGNRILVDSGRLRSSFLPTNFRAAPGGIQWYNPAKTKDGFPYAFAHDNDTKPRSRLPRRDFMWLSRGAQERIAEITIRWILEE